MLSFHTTSFCGSAGVELDGRRGEGPHQFIHAIIDPDITCEEPLIGSTKKLEEFCTRYMIGRLYNAC